LRHVAIEDLQGMMGQLGMTPFHDQALFGFDFFKTIESKFHNMFGHHDKRLRDWKDWDEDDDDDSAFVINHPEKDNEKPPTKKDDSDTIK